MSPDPVLSAAQEKIPGFAQSLIILPRTKKYNRLYVQPIQCVVDGKAPEPQKSFLAKWFAKNATVTVKSAAPGGDGS